MLRQQFHCAHGILTARQKLLDFRTLLRQRFEACPDIDKQIEIPETQEDDCLRDRAVDAGSSCDRSQVAMHESSTLKSDVRTRDERGPHQQTDCECESNSSLIKEYIRRDDITDARCEVEYSETSSLLNSVLHDIDGLASIDLPDLGKDTRSQYDDNTNSYLNKFAAQAYEVMRDRVIHDTLLFNAASSYLVVTEDSFPRSCHAINNQDCYETYVASEPGAWTGDVPAQKIADIATPVGEEASVSSHKTCEDLDNRNIDADRCESISDSVSKDSSRVSQDSERTDDYCIEERRENTCNVRSEASNFGSCMKSGVENDDSSEDNLADSNPPDGAPGDSMPFDHEFHIPSLPLPDEELLLRLKNVKSEIEREESHKARQDREHRTILGGKIIELLKSDMFTGCKVDTSATQLGAIEEGIECAATSKGAFSQNKKGSRQPESTFPVAPEYKVCTEEEGLYPVGGRGQVDFRNSDKSNTTIPTNDEGGSYSIASKDIKPGDDNRKLISEQRVEFRVRKAAQQKRTNFVQIKNAISNVCMAGVHQSERRNEVISILNYFHSLPTNVDTESESESIDAALHANIHTSVRHFIVMFSRSKMLSYRALYAAHPKFEGLYLRIHGRGPSKLSFDDVCPDGEQDGLTVAEVVREFLKFDTSTKSFLSLPVKSISSAVDAIVLHHTGRSNSNLR